MTEQPYDGGDLSYDAAHDAHVPQPPRPTRAEPPRSADPPADLSGDYSYDLAHDVPRG